MAYMNCQSFNIVRKAYDEEVYVLRIIPRSEATLRVLNILLDMASLF